MLIRFSIENFSSFKDRVEFSMIPGKGILKQNHKTKPIKGISTLKAGFVFGANASGKSNLIKAINFGKLLILNGTKSEQPIGYQPFRLDVQSTKANSRIEYEIQHKNKNYAYGFVFNSTEIVEEWLYEINNKSDKKIFERNLNTPNQFDIEPLFKKNNKEEEKQFLKFIAKGTPDNQLFLSEIKNRKVRDNVTDISDLLNIIDWFQNSLKVIFPDDKYKEGIKSELKDGSKIQLAFEELLQYFDTGINGISLEKTTFDKIGIPDKLIEKFKDDLCNAKSNNVRIILTVNNQTYFISKGSDDLVVRKFMTKHNVKGQKKQELFDTKDESDGTNKIIDYIPLLMDLLQGDNVFVVDEIERSLHPNIIYDIIDLFLTKSENINSQLIIATHESSLLTQKLLRKDEIWFAVKDTNGVTHLHSLEEYNIRFDKEIRKDYLIGRFKAIPKIRNRSELSVLPTTIKE